MDDNQSPELTPPSEPNVYQPQPRTPQPSFEPPAPKKSHKFVLIIVMLTLLLIAGGAAAYLMSQEEDTAPVETSQKTEETAEESEVVEETESDVTYQSTLYPDLSFTLPEGWEVTEPETYTNDSIAEGTANSTITVSNGDAILKLELNTALVTGFEGHSCYSRENLIAVGSVYRFEGSEGVIVYQAGISEADEEWANVIAQEGEFTSFEDPNPNYCSSFPYLGTYSSTLNQADYPDSPYGFTDQEKVIIWLSAYLVGTPTVEQIADTDAIIQSLSQPDLGV